MTKLEQYKTFVAVMIEGGEVLETHTFDKLADVLDQASEYGLEWVILGVNEGATQGDTITVQIAEAMADAYVEDQYHDLQDEDWSEDACEFISAHAQDYLEDAIEEARIEFRGGQPTFPRSWPAAYKGAA